MATERWLSRRQARVNAQPDPATKYLTARDLFSSKAGNSFDEIRSTLSDMSPPGKACFYCERDRYRDIDHIRPIRFFPETCFSWQNFVYACTRCNQDAKRDQVWIINESGELLKYDRSTPLGTALPRGLHALIDIRHEDPLEFLALELETGLFVAIGQDAVTRLRGCFTRDLFGLNSDDLSKIRRQMRETFILYLTRYSDATRAGDPDAAERALDEIKELPHPTVLDEIRRQAPSDSRTAPLLDGLPAWPNPLR
ncbi:MAG: HNH endonuclease [Acetobacteraceae bacterium]|nr:HNH endonuclease [Acetobacteraceae bacterium]